MNKFKKRNIVSAIVSFVMCVAWLVFSIYSLLRDYTIVSISAASLSVAFEGLFVYNLVNIMEDKQ